LQARLQAFQTENYGRNSKNEKCFTNSLQNLRVKQQKETPKIEKQKTGAIGLMKERFINKCYIIITYVTKI
jgi:hypothetical protein